jgi:hypothetical protein
MFCMLAGVTGAGFVAYRIVAERQRNLDAAVALVERTGEAIAALGAILTDTDNAPTGKTSSLEPDRATDAALRTLQRCEASSAATRSNRIAYGSWKTCFEAGARDCFIRWIRQKAATGKPCSIPPIRTRKSA